MALSLAGSATKSASVVKRDATWLLPNSVGFFEKNLSEGCITIVPDNLSEGCITIVPADNLSEGCITIVPDNLSEGCITIVPDKLSEGCSNKYIAVTTEVRLSNGRAHYMSWTSNVNVFAFPIILYLTIFQIMLNHNN